MDGKAGRIWAVALAIGAVAYVILLGLAGYGWFKGLLLAILVVFLVALILLFLWDEDPVEPVAAQAPAPPAPPAGTPAFVPAGETEGPPPGGVTSFAEKTGPGDASEAEMSDPGEDTDDSDESPPAAALAARAADLATGPEPKPAAKAASGRASATRGKSSGRADPRPMPRAAKPAAKPAAAKAAAKPAAPKAAKSSAKPATGGDDLKLIKGVGPKLEATLHGLGITSFAQIAGWSPADVERVDGELKFQGRIDRDGWIEQARILAEGGETEFSRGKKR